MVSPPGIQLVVKTYTHHSSLVRETSGTKKPSALYFRKARPHHATPFKAGVSHLFTQSCPVLPLAYVPSGCFLPFRKAAFLPFAPSHRFFFLDLDEPSQVATTRALEKAPGVDFLRRVQPPAFSASRLNDLSTTFVVQIGSAFPMRDSDFTVCLSFHHGSHFCCHLSAPVVFRGTLRLSLSI